SRGRNGGPLIDMGDGQVEISVFETNVPPCFRLYFFDGACKSSDPDPQTVTIETVRPGGERQHFEFRAGDGFLESTTDTPEPHEFEVRLTLVRAGVSRTVQTRFTEEAHGHDHGEHGHDHGAHGHGHTHGFVDPLITTTGRGLWAIKWSFIALF